MMRQLLLFLLIALLPWSAYARLSQEEFEHAKSALMFAERRQWDDARMHAAEVHEASFSALIDWQYYLDPDSQAGFDDIVRFISEHAQWPEQRRLRLRAEMALKDAQPADHDIIAWFANDPPVTGVGKIALAEAQMRQQLSNSDAIATLIRDAWKDGDFDGPETKRIAEAYANILTPADHIARADRLLWEEKISQAEDMMPMLPADYRKVVKARMALIENEKNAAALVSQVPEVYKNDPGLIYDRLRARIAKGDDKGVRELLFSLPKQVPYPEKWWKLREPQIRKAIDEGHYAIASKLLANHAQQDGQGLAEALWLQGWIALEFMNQPRPAYDAFYRMFNDVKYPVSKARAAYWAARAAEKAGDASSAGNWYDTASAYPNVFYGQLATLKVNGSAPLRIPAPVTPSADEQHAFDEREVVRAVRLAVEMDKGDLASRLISGLIEATKDDTEAAMIAAIGREIGQPYLSVRGAKKALQKYNAVLIKESYPLPATPVDLAVERALALSITRQESEFDPEAKSPSGALGMMQLLPSTAKETAHRHDMGFNVARLYEPAYNWTLGSFYLDRMIENYDGSYVMAIASYNAGPGNVRKWAQQFGTPGNKIDNAVNWIEKIPFPETRNYVQRVLENLQMYRHLMADGEAPTLKLEEDLER